MTELHLGLGPRQGPGAVVSIAVVQLVDEIQKLGPRGCDDGPEGDPRDPAGRDHHASSEREDRIEHGPDRVRQRSAVRDAGRRADRPAPADEASPVRLVLRIVDDVALHDGEMGGEHLRLAVRARTARGDERTELGDMLGLHEHFGERRMRGVGGRRRQNQLGVGREFDLARLASAVGQGDAADLAVVLAGDQDVHDGRQRAVATEELGVVLAEDDLLVVRLAPDRLRARRPHGAAAHVPQDDEGAPVVARRVLPPSGHGDVAPPAVARPDGRQHHGVPAVRQEMRDRGSDGRGRDATDRGHHGARRGGGGVQLFGARVRDGYVPGHAFLKQ